MKRYEIYINSAGSISLSCFSSLNLEYEEFVVSGEEAYYLITKLSSYKLLEVYEFEKNDEAVLKYSEFVIRLNECEKLIRRNRMKPIIDNVKHYYEEKRLKSIKRKKVKRKNNYVNTRIMAGSLAGIILFLGALGLSKDKRNVETSYPSVVAEAQVKPEVHIETLDLEVDEIEDGMSVFIEYEDRSNTEKAHVTKAYYSDLIDKYARTYGLDPHLVLAIATQERGIHSETRDVGGATGLMQIQNAVWEDQVIQAYNFETNCMEEVHVTRDMIKDVYKNVKIGCMYFQNCMNYMNNNVLAAIQCYNMGYGNMQKILTAYSNSTNRTIEEILSDPNDIGWLDYRCYVKEGDPCYIENVLSWIGSDFKLEIGNKDGTTNILNITNNSESKKIY